MQMEQSSIVNQSPLTPRRNSKDSASLFGNSISKTIQKSGVKSKYFQRQQSHIHTNEYLSTFLDTIGKKRSFDDAQNNENPTQVNRSATATTASSPSKQSVNPTNSTVKRQKSSSISEAILPTSPKLQLHDRFIPNRANIDVEYSYFALEKRDENAENIQQQEQEQLMTPGQRKLKEQLTNLKSGSFTGHPSTQKKRLIDVRKSLTPAFDRMDYFSEFKQQKEVLETTTPRSKSIRTFPVAAAKVLDCPDLVNDYYLNLLHWGQNNILSIALGKTVFLWNSDDSSTQTLMELPEEDPSSYISSVQWSPDASYLAIGTSLNTTQIWDVSSQRLLREFESHSNRVSSLAWQSSNVFSSGGKDSLIINHDLRIRRPVISYFTGHTQEVCGLTWSPDGSTLASGGNENMLCFWDFTYSPHNNIQQLSGLSQQSYSPRIKLEQHHIAAVKALGWCPWQRNILASGGGTADRNLKIWNTSDGKCLKSVDTGSQVCALQWSESYKEIVSSHGFSDNQLIIWKYSDMTKLHELHGHTARVLHLAKSPCGTTICSASADETLRFWNLFDRQRSDYHCHDPHLSSLRSPLSSSKKLRNNSVLLSSTPGLSMTIR